VHICITNAMSVIRSVSFAIENSWHACFCYCFCPVYTLFSVRLTADNNNNNNNNVHFSPAIRCLLQRRSTRPCMLTPSLIRRHRYCFGTVWTRRNRSSVDDYNWQVETRRVSNELEVRGVADSSDWASTVTLSDQQLQFAADCVRKLVHRWNAV